VERDQFVVWDIVGRRGAQLHYGHENGNVKLLDVTPIDLSPNAH
jgi:hypothetical protein